MKRLFLHAGHAKTGTTSAQFALASMRRELSEAGFLYPEFTSFYGYQHGSHLALWDAKRLPELTAFWREQAEIYRRAPEHTIILSAEAASFSTHEHCVLFREIFADFHLSYVLALRHWSGFCPSRWQLHISYGDSLSFPSMLKRLDADFDISVSGDLSLPLRRANRAFDQLMGIPYSTANFLPKLFGALNLPDQFCLQPPAAARQNAAQSFADVEGERLCNLILGPRRGRPPDQDYKAAIDMSVGAWFTAHAMQQQFLQSDLPGAQKLKGLVSDAAKTIPRRHWAPLFNSWTQRVNTSLSGMNLPVMPDFWGEDEAEGDVTFTELELGDLPPRCIRDYLDFVRDWRNSKRAET